MEEKTWEKRGTGWWTWTIGWVGWTLTCLYQVKKIIWTTNNFWNRMHFFFHISNLNNKCLSIWHGHKLNPTLPVSLQKHTQGTYCCSPSHWSDSTWQQNPHQKLVSWVWGFQFHRCFKRFFKRRIPDDFNWHLDPANWRILVKSEVANYSITAQLSGNLWLLHFMKFRQYPQVVIPNFKVWKKKTTKKKNTDPWLIIHHPLTPSHPPKKKIKHVLIDFVTTGSGNIFVHLFASIFLFGTASEVVKYKQWYLSDGPYLQGWSI